jgi:sugar phosphate isomerase/epimerase
VIVAASTECFADLNLHDAMSRLVDLEYTSVEITLHEDSNQLRPSQVAKDLEAAVASCRDTHRLTPIAYSVEITAPGEEYYQQFAACCKLMKSTKVVAVTVRSGELGTPFNTEVERLRRMVAMASLDGVQVGIKTEVGRLTQDPVTAANLCENVPGLGITLDPSHYIYGPFSNANYQPLLKYIYHTQLRDTTKDKLQVRVGQGSVDYGRLITQLGMVDYNRALSVHITPMPDVDHAVEMRKMRLLLESLL